MQESVKDISATQQKIITIAAVFIAVLFFGGSVMDFIHVTRDNSDAVKAIDFANLKNPQMLPTINTVTRIGWFGLLPEEQGGISADANNARLLSRFELKGISSSADKELAGAFIAEKGKPEAYYHIGDALPGGAGTLSEIFPDHVSVRQGQSLADMKFQSVNK